MRLEIPLTEVIQFVSNQYNIDIELVILDKNKIEVTYYDSAVLIINEVNDGVIQLNYEVDGLAYIVTKIAHLFLKNKLDNTPLVWDSKNNELKIDMNQLTELNTLLQFVSISNVHFIKDNIVLEMPAKDKTEIPGN